MNCVCGHEKARHVFGEQWCTVVTKVGNTTEGQSTHDFCRCSAYQPANSDPGDETKAA